MILTIATREFKNLFLSPLAWGILAAMHFVQGLIFYRLLQTYQLNPPQIDNTHAIASGVTYHIASLFLGSISYSAMLAIPMLTMSLISGERRRNSWPLLASAPVGYHQIILGKYLGLQFFLWLLLCSLFILPLSLLPSVPMDVGILATSFIGVLLTLAAYSALGILMSALTNSPATAAFSTLAVLLVLWITEMLAGSGISWLDSGIVYLSIFQHLSPMLRGLLDTRDIMYFLILIAGFLSLATQQLYSKRI